MKKLISLFMALLFMFMLVGCNNDITHQEFFKDIKINYDVGDQDNVKGNFEFVYNENKNIKVVFSSLNEDVIIIEDNKAFVTQGEVDILVTVEVAITIKKETKTYEIIFNVLKLEQIIIPDTTPPVITGVKDFTYTIGDQLPNYLEGVSATDDIDGSVGVTVDDSLVDLTKEGIYNIYFIAIDSSGNETRIKKQVTVIKLDTTAPIITGTKDFTYTIGDAAPNYLEGVSATDDIDGSVGVTVDDSLVDLTKEGIYNIYFIAVDSSGNQSKIEKQITVIKPDTTAPIITGLKDFTYTIGDAAPNYLEEVSATDDIDGSISVTVDDSLVDLTKEGIYNIYFIAVDSSGNQSKIEKQITVIKPDTTPPVITGVKDFTYTIGDQLPNYLEGVSATDDIDGSVGVTVDDSLVDLTKAGVYNIYFIAIDSSGNETKIEKQVTVIKPDTTAPVITGIKDFIYTIGDVAPNYLEGVSATDDVDGEVIVEVMTPFVDLTKVGIYSIFYIATDSSGNKVTVEAKIEVIKQADQTPPVITGAKDFIYTIEDPLPNYLVGVSATDDVDGIVNVTVDDSLVDLTKEGIYNIYFIAIDSSGNETRIEKQVTVIYPISTEEFITETFDNLPSSGSSYVDDDFVGVNGIFWSYNSSRTDLTLDGKALTFRHESNAKLYTTLQNGLSSFSISAAHEFSGDDIRNIALYVDGVEVAVFGVISGVFQTFTVDNLNFQGEVLIEVRNIGANRVKIDNIILGFGNKTVEEKLLESVYKSLNIPLTFISSETITLPVNINGVNIVWEYVNLTDPNNQYLNLANGNITIPTDDIIVDVFIKAILTYEGYESEKEFILKIGEGEPVSILAARNTTNGSHIKTQGIITSSILKDGIYYAFMEDSKNGIYLESTINLTAGTEVVLKAVKQIVNGVVTLTNISDVKIINNKQANISIITLDQLNNFLGMYIEVTGFLTKATLNNQTEYEIATIDGIVKIVLPNYINQTALENLFSQKEEGVKVSLEGYVYNNETIYLIDGESLNISDIVFNEEISEIIINNLDFPLNNQETITDLNLPTNDNVFNASISWMSSNINVLSDTGKVTTPKTDTTVTLYYVIKIGLKTIKEGSVNIVVLASEALMAYYSAVEGVIGNDLLLGLRTIITTGRKNTSYDQAKTILQETDRDPNNSNNILLVYNRVSIKKEWLSSLPWNREHVWPQSFLGSAPQGEIHNLKPADTDINNSRGNKPFARGSGSYAIVAGGWYPGDDDIGDVARIMFYMITAYKDLRISTMGSLEMFIEWHNADPVDDFERNRNEVIFGYTNNRNPFIDYPHFVNLIWGSSNTYSIEQQTTYNYDLNILYVQRKRLYLEA